MEIEFLVQLNLERAARGIAPLRSDSGLVGASTRWSANMAASQNLAHSSDGRAEIVARGYRTGQITAAWMNSAGHRNLITDPNLGVAGVGVVCDGNGQIWATVQFYRTDTRLGTQTSSPSSPVVTPSNVGSGCSDSPVTNQVKRLYQAYFRRESDPGGLAYWVGRMADGLPLWAVSAMFEDSNEFRTAYGSLNNRDFVRRVYLNVMNREPDAGGYDFWVRQLRNGMSRGELMIGFSESQEFRSRTGLS